MAIVTVKEQPLTKIKTKHILSAHDIPEAEIQNLFSMADKYKRGSASSLKHLEGKTLGTIFYDPSSRTRPGFEAAMHKLGGNVVSIENACNSTSYTRGETLEDLIRSTSGYYDAIALRHPEPGSAVKASQVSECPIINCRDGNNEHPIQALADLYTIQRTRPTASNIMFIGDIASSATATSMVNFANMFDMHVYYAGNFRPTQLPPGNHTSLAEVNIGSYISQADVIYMVGSVPGGAVSKFKLTLDYLHALKAEAIIMHTLPRGKELPVDIDSDPRSIYFQQSKNGLYIRMAILQYLMGK